MSTPLAWTDFAPRRAAISVMVMARASSGSRVWMWSRLGNPGARGPGGGTDDHRPDERGRLRELAVGDIDGEALAAQRLLSRAVAVAADEEAIDPVHPVLSPGERL